MPPSEDPKAAAAADEFDFDATDSGWDPYVTSLLAGLDRPGDGAPEEKDAATPVMSFSRRPKTPVEP